ncbi:MAG: hypothetical protein Q8O83_00060 [bacterium]|nr:hypothetical protein [bacterium]
MQKHPAIIVFSLLFFVLGIWSLFFFLKPGWKTPVYRQERTDTQKISASNTNALSVDTDNDGLKDWEEKLLGTDPNTPDTDGDGTPDGKEIFSGRDPLLAGPNDAIPFKPSDTNKDAYKDTDQLALNITRQLSENPNISEQAMNTVIDTQLIQTIQQAPALPDTYTEHDIAVIKEPTKESIQEYANTIGSIFEISFEYIEKGELELLREIGRNKEKQDTTAFLAYREAYVRATKLLGATPVPAQYVSAHLALLNNFYNLSVINDTFSRFFENPIEGAIAISYYNKEAERFQTFIQNITAQLEADALTFSENETGHILFAFRDETR